MVKNTSKSPKNTSKTPQKHLKTPYKDHLRSPGPDSLRHHCHRTVHIQHNLDHCGGLRILIGKYGILIGKWVILMGKWVILRYF
jgi:hypothetical protein